MIFYIVEAALRFRDPWARDRATAAGLGGCNVVSSACNPSQTRKHPAATGCFLAMGGGWRAGGAKRGYREGVLLTVTDARRGDRRRRRTRRQQALPTTPQLSRADGPSPVALHDSNAWD